MSRLIDADKLIKELHEALDGSGYDEDYKDMGIDDFIMSQPTAYDVEKVVEELHEFSLNTIPYCNEMLREDLCDDSNDCDYCKLQHAIEIVRKGGVE